MKESGEFLLLKDTGERVIPELMKPTNGLLLEHLARYSFSTPYIHGRVLDIACGSGYGTHMMAKSCKKENVSIVGVDIDPETIEYAIKKYHHQKVEFKTADCTDPELPTQLGYFDTILCFETIEHVQEDGLLLRNLYNMLKPGGTLVISTPFGKGRGEPCGSIFHIHQYTKQEFIEMFQEYTEAEFFFQRGVAIELGIKKPNGEVAYPRKNIRYPFGIAVCTK